MKQPIHLMTKINDKQSSISVEPKDINQLSRWEQFEYNLHQLTIAAKDLADEADGLYQDMREGKMFVPWRGDANQ